MDVPVEFLESIPYYSGLSLAELNAIRKFFFSKTIDRGEILLREGESAEVLYFVVVGAVKVFKTSAEGKEQILNIVRPEEFFNDVSIFGDGQNLANAQAMTPVVLFGINKDDLKVILRDYPAVAMNVIKVLAGRVRQLVSLVEDLSFRHVVNRVAKILLKYIGDSENTVPRLTQQEIAAMAGTAREVVSRSLKVLEEEGVIRMDRHRIMIIDRESLQKIMEAYS